MASTRAITALSISSTLPHSRAVSAPILLVASMPSLPPRLGFGDAKFHKLPGLMGETGGAGGCAATRGR